MAQGTASLTDIWRNTILCRIRAGGNFARATITRADVSTCATRWLNDGTLGTVAASVLRTEWVDLDGDGIRETPGISLEGTRTNVVLWNRDMTNAAWTKTTMTAAKDQVGLDGVTNSASSLLATAGNATCLQAIVLASSQRAQSVWVKRLVGSGTINMTMDNGATWTVISVTSTITWTKVTIPSQTLANPTVGFRIVTNADKIAVDYVQNENGAFESSPIAVTTTAITRASDGLTVPVNYGPAMDVTILARFARPVWADGAGTLDTNPFDILCLADTATAALQLRCSNTSRVVQAPIRGTSGFSQPSNQNIPAGTSLIFTAQYKNLTTTPAAAFDVGTGLGAFATGATAFMAYGSQVLRIGSYTTSGFLYGVLLDVLVTRGLRTRQEMLVLAGRD